MLGILAESLRIATLSDRPRQPAPSPSGATRKGAAGGWSGRETVTD